METSRPRQGADRTDDDIEVEQACQMLVVVLP